MSDLGSQASMNEVYRERNLAVALAAALIYESAGEHGVYGYIDPADPEWVVVFLETGSLRGKQLSWHMPRAEVHEFLPGLRYRAENPWDGHTTAEKEHRILRFIDLVFHLDFAEYDIAAE